MGKSDSDLLHHGLPWAPGDMACSATGSNKADTPIHIHCEKRQKMGSSRSVLAEPLTSPSPGDTRSQGLGVTRLNQTFVSNPARTLPVSIMLDVLNGRNL